jgi:uncharacterized membrane protein
LFSFFQKKIAFFTPEEKQHIVEAIRQAEKKTSGEVRVFVESRCSFMDAIDRAAEIFSRLNMQQTKDRNGVLVYVAMKDRQLAVFGDEGIHRIVGDEYWNIIVKKMLHDFNRDNYADGISHCVGEVGEALRIHFPYDKDIDKNELPDDIVFGR